MDGDAAHRSAQAPAGRRLVDLDEVGGAIVECDAAGQVTAGSPSGRAILERLGVLDGSLPALLAPDLWRVIEARAIGEAVQWRSPHDGQSLLGCTRYRLGADRWLLVMSEISQKQSVLAQRLHAQRLESLGRLVATTAHDLRAPLASIVFNTDSLATRFDDLTEPRRREMIDDVRTAASRLGAAIDCLLDFVRLGPPSPSEVSLSEVVTRTQSLLRPRLRTGGHHLVAEIAADAARAVGNALAIEQIFVNLVLNSIEAAHQPTTIRLTSSRDGAMVRVMVEDDGPGIRPEHRLQIFDPFFTTRADGTGIGLTSAREAARDAGGDLVLVRWVGGASFAVTLPAGAAEAAR